MSGYVLTCTGMSETKSQRRLSIVTKRKRNQTKTNVTMRCCCRLFATCIKAASTWEQFISFKFRLQCSKYKLKQHMAYFLIQQSDDPVIRLLAGPSFSFLILMPIIPIEISLILIVYSGASVIRTPTTRTLHLPDKFYLGTDFFVPLNRIFKIRTVVFHSKL